MTLKNILESFLFYDFIKKELEKLKKKYPNIPYEISPYYNIESFKREVYHSYEDQPAEIFYNHKNGEIKAKVWYKNGKQHRSKNKPAVIIYDENGKIKKVEYWFNGIEIKPLPQPLQKSQDQTRRDLDYKL